MGSIGIISLTTRRNRRFFISAETYPVVKVRSHRGETSRRPTEVERRPAIRWSVTSGVEGTDQGLDGGPDDGPWRILDLLEMVPRLFD